MYAMTGTVAIKESVERLCSIEATIAEPVQFGFGILGRLDAGGHLGLERTPVYGDDWKTARIVVHLEGKVLLLKSLTRDKETTRTDIRVLPTRPTIVEAIELTRG